MTDESCLYIPIPPYRWTNPILNVSPRCYRALCFPWLKLNFALHLFGGKSLDATTFFNIAVEEGKSKVLKLLCIWCVAFHYQEMKEFPGKMKWSNYTKNQYSYLLQSTIMSMVCKGFCVFCFTHAVDHVFQYSNY